MTPYPIDEMFHQEPSPLTEVVFFNVVQPYQVNLPHQFCIWSVNLLVFFLNFVDIY